MAPAPTQPESTGPQIMHLFIITGFLGSGKTTLVTRLAKRATAKGLKVGILVNEVGEMGIDDQFMRRLGLNVWEILGGCICCTLTADLIETLKNLKRDFEVDLVLVEPSGAADPRAVISTLRDYDDGSVSERLQIALLDPLRMDMLMEVLSPLTTSTMQSADLILINKVDVASPEQVEYAYSKARQANPDTQIHVVSAKNDLEPAVWEEVEKWMP